MTTCMESYVCICENLEWNPSPEAKEALEVIREFRNIFESADAAIENPVLQEICRNISRIHFGSALPLETMPVDTIRKEFKKRTGKDISSYFCTIAYHNTIKADKEKARKGQNSGILDADTEQRKSLLHQLKEKTERCAEENREDKTTSGSGKECLEDCLNCTCKGGN